MSIFTPYRVTTAVVASGLIAAACGGLDYPAAPPPPKGSGGSPLSENCTTIKQQARAVLQANCAGCHEAPNKSGNFDYVLDTDHLSVLEWENTPAARRLQEITPMNCRRSITG